jgi:hypothetical protein
MFHQDRAPSSLPSHEISGDICGEQTRKRQEAQRINITAIKAENGGSDENFMVMISCDADAALSRELLKFFRPIGLIEIASVVSNSLC